MDITNEKNTKINPALVNGQSVYYMIAAVAACLVYFIFTKVSGLFIPPLPAQLLGIGLSAAAFFMTANRYVFIKSRKTMVWRIAFYGLMCAVDYGIIYLFTRVVQPQAAVTAEVCEAFAFLIILILNYPICNRIIFKSSISPSVRVNGRLFRRVLSNRFVLLSGVTAAFIMLFVYFCYSAYPFGDTTILRMDLYHQYGPLFGELYDRIQNGESLLYSWQSGGGSLFLGNFFNYLSSPLSFLILLFDRNQIPGAISMIVLVKAALSATSFTLYLKLSKKRSSFLTAGFGLLYAFCGFFLAYYWNVMWIDALYLLPMVAYGIESIIHRGKMRVYIVALILMMFSNYYMSFILCIFSVLYFLAYYFSYYNPGAVLRQTEESGKLHKLWNRRLLRAGILFAGASLLAAAISAIALLPTYQALQASSATAGTFPTEISTYFDLFDFLSNHLPAMETTIRSSGGDVLPNIYSGVIVLILVPLYMMNRSIATREKIANVLLLTLLVVSFNTNILNYIWHAFHFPNDLPYRFSFLYTFVILNMAFKVLTKWKHVAYRDIMLVGMLVLFFVVLAEKMPNKYIKEDMTLYVSIAFTLLYVCILTLIKKKTLSVSILSFLLFLTMGVEIIVGSTDSYVLSQKYENYAGDYNSYQKILDKIDLYEKDSADKPRTEQFHLRTRMDPSWYGYNGISTFSSMAYEKMAKLQYNLGMSGNRINSYTYNPQTPVYNAMFGLKYLIGTDYNIPPNEKYYTKLFTDGSGDITVYQNNYYLPLAFCVSPNITNWYFEEGDPFAVQNGFIRNACGINQVFQPISVDSTSRMNVKDFYFTGNGTFNYEKYGEGEATVTFTLKTKTDGNVYLYASSYATKKATVTSDSVNLNYDFDQPYILDVGHHQAGEEITVTFTIGDGNASTLDFYSYSIDQHAFDDAYNQLNRSVYEISESSDSRIIGTVSAEKESTLYTSIPYDKGWRVLIDGEATETFPIGDALIGVAMPAGNHEVEFRFVPSGLKAGFAVSSAALLSLVGYGCLRYARQGRKKVKNDANSTI